MPIGAFSRGSTARTDTNIASDTARIVGTHGQLAESGALLVGNRASYAESGSIQIGPRGTLNAAPLTGVNLAGFQGDINLTYGTNDSEAVTSLAQSFTGTLERLSAQNADNLATLASNSPGSPTGANPITSADTGAAVGASAGSASISWSTWGLGAAAVVLLFWFMRRR